MKLSAYLLGGVLLFTPAAWASTLDQSVHDQILRDNSDIALSREAALRAGTPATSIYARHAEAIHRAARARLARLTPDVDPEEMSSEAAQELRLLSTLVGHEFDVEYLRYMAQAQAQQIHDLATSVSARDDRIGQLARAEIPRLEYGAQRAKVLEYRERDEPHA